MTPKDTPIRQSAALAYRMEEKRLMVLLVTSRGSRRWVIPKGTVEGGLSLAETAAKEAFEEAGVAGRMGPDSIGSYRYFKSDTKDGRACVVSVFAMEVLVEKSEWPEKHQRKKEWVPLNDAVRLVQEKKLKQILLNFPKSLKRGAVHPVRG